MAGETPATFYALTSPDGINPLRRLVLQCPPGLGTLCSQVLWQKLKANHQIQRVTSVFCPPGRGSRTQADCISETPGYQGQRGQNEVMCKRG